RGGGRPGGHGRPIHRGAARQFRRDATGVARARRWAGVVPGNCPCSEEGRSNHWNRRPLGGSHRKDSPRGDCPRSVFDSDGLSSVSSPASRRAETGTVPNLILTKVSQGTEVRQITPPV